MIEEKKFLEFMKIAQKVLNHCGGEITELIDELFPSMSKFEKTKLCGLCSLMVHRLMEKRKIILVERGIK